MGKKKKGLGHFSLGGVRAVQAAQATGGEEKRKTGNYNLIRPCYAWHCLLVGPDKCRVGERERERT